MVRYARGKDWFLVHDPAEPKYNLNILSDHKYHHDRHRKPYVLEQTSNQDVISLFDTKYMILVLRAVALKWPLLLALPISILIYEYQADKVHIPHHC